MGTGSRWENSPEAVVFPVSTDESQARMQGQGTAVTNGQGPGPDVQILRCRDLHPPPSRCGGAGCDQPEGPHF